ncbi:EAL domain-containing protein [Methylomonas sp. MO1]|uniref:bifunctional diguanylate cyclase/phosphodiesterase n=1 Tax=Methylomonas sp. MO1 TaxID=3073619 RepID=UPI0028A3D9B6|nr:EAL domain-containing protein [Methylomonas sp. MO1]MDT4291531.1 EAL domain-containing protein [Methylomonas sp. MO1]
MKNTPSPAEQTVLPEAVAPSFTRVLISNIVGLVMLLGLALLVGMTWQSVTSTEETTRREVKETLDRATERLLTLIRAAEMTAESAERAAIAPEVTGATLQSTLEYSLAAFEQRPELSYLGISLAASGEYGALERTANGEILLWLFPGNRTEGPLARKFILTEQGFVLHQQLHNQHYDPRSDAFYEAALRSPSGDTWVPAYRWAAPFTGNEPLWGFSYGKVLKDAGGRLIGVLDADFDIPALNSFLRAIGTEYHSQFQILELGAAPRLIGDPLQVGRAPLPLPAELNPLLNFAGELFLDRMLVEGEQRWVAARRMPLKGGMSWLVITSRKVSYIEDMLRRQLYQVGGMGVAITAGLVLVSMRMARRFGKPLAALERRVAGISHTELEAPAAATFATNEFRETQILGEALDHMAVAVKQLLEAKEQQAASLALKGAIFDSTHTAIFSLDHQLAVIEWNAAAERLFGLAREYILGKNITDAVFAPDGRADWAEILSTTDSGAFQFLGTQGVFDAELRVAAFRRNGLEVRTLFLNDISERQRADAALRESLARFHAATRATGDVVWDWDFASNDIWWSENFQIVFGYTADEILPSFDFWARRIHPDDRDRVVAHLQATVAGSEKTWSEEYRFRRKDGSYADLFDRGQLLCDDTGRGVRMIGAIQDITARKQAELQIRYLATYDGLTGLPNRDLIQDRIAQAIAHARRAGSQLALLYLDLDRFKVVNDGYGHPFGDAVLKVAAERLGSLIRDGDTVSRLGGDEFLILLTDLNKDSDAYFLAQKVVQNLDSPLLVQGRNIHLSVSIGVSVFPQDGETAEALIDNADVAMYRAKDLGRNTCQFFTREMSEETLRRVNIETRLREALAAGQFQLAYQPKVNLKNGQISGCEALLRWQHPEMGAVSPAQFIPIAEDSGLIVPIGDWVLRAACAQAKAWTDAGLPPVCVAVNISARQFLQQDVISWVMNTLQATGLPASQLELELTESLIAEDVEKVIATFSQLRSAGVKLSIDDFGTGYSSLSYLKRFRVDTLKIDQSFVRDMLTDPEDATIVLAVIALAHNLAFKVIAEGVETEPHCQFLREHHCDEIQGYYFSKPLPASEFEALLRTGKHLT